MEKSNKEIRRRKSSAKREKMMKFLGFEVNKLSKVLIRTLNAAEYIESDTQNIEAPRTDDPII